MVLEIIAFDSDPNLRISMNPLFHEMIERSRRSKMTDGEREAQQISFAYGNLHIEEVSVTREIDREEFLKLKAARLAQGNGR